MGFFDKLKDSVADTAKSVVGDLMDNHDNDGLNGADCESIVLSSIPSNLAELKAMDGADFKDPNKVVALTIAALCIYPVSKDNCIEMLNFLKGPRPLSNYEISFLADRFRGKDYLMASYFVGATPQNNYEPNTPYTVNVYTTKHSEDQKDEGYLQLYVKSGGADTARGVKLRNKPSTGEWFLWEYFVLPDIRKPVQADPWA